MQGVPKSCTSDQKTTREGRAITEERNIKGNVKKQQGAGKKKGENIEQIGHHFRKTTGGRCIGKARPKAQGNHNRKEDRSGSNGDNEDSLGGCLR